jgi:hypothetical protein
VYKRLTKSHARYEPMSRIQADVCRLIGQSRHILILLP